MLNTYTVNYEQAEREIVMCMSKGLVALLTSSPGMGKSSLARKIAKKYRLKLIDIRLSTYTPEDLNGLPMRNGARAEFLPFDTFPLEGDEIPEGYEGWLILFDEITSANKSLQAAAYRTLLDKEVGQHKLHPAVAMMAAGNKMTDRAVVNQMSTALQSRMIHYELAVDFRSFQKNVAYKIGIDPRIMGFLSYMPNRLMDFRPDHQDKTFPCPRTWEFLSKLIEDETVIDEELAPRVAGTIGAGAAAEFITFAKEFDRLPKISDILINPTKAAVPPESSTKYATMSMLIQHFDMDNLDDILVYAKRFEIEFQIIFTRGSVARNDTIRFKHAKFGEYLQDMGRYLQ